MNTYAPTGLLIWNFPPLSIANSQWDIAYLVSGYRNGTFAYSMMRDMLIYVNGNTTGIDETALNALTISPNPATDKLVISTSLDRMDVSVSDLSGRVLAVPISDNEINVSTLPSGIYCLRLQNSNGSIIRKFVKD
jgi:hypothetical protein